MKASRPPRAGSRAGSGVYGGRPAARPSSALAHGPLRVIATRANLEESRMPNKLGNDDLSQGAGQADMARNAGSTNGGGGRSNRGFASMDPSKQKEIASKGGKAAHAKGTAHEFDSGEARD